MTREQIIDKLREILVAADGRGQSSVITYHKAAATSRINGCTSIPKSVTASPAQINRPFRAPSFIVGTLRTVHSV